MSEFWRIFFAFLKVGTFGFGGGQATIPLIEAEVVDGKMWITGDRFADFLIMGQSLPGPIAPKMSMIIGYDILGFPGALAAFVGILLPSSIGIIIMYTFFMEYKDEPFVKGMQVTAKVVVVSLIGGVAFSMARSSIAKMDGMLSHNSLIIIGVFLLSASLVLLNEYKIFTVHPSLIIIGGLLIGGFFIR